MADELAVAISKDGLLRARAACLSDLVRDALIRHLPNPLGAHALGRALGCAAVYPMEWKHNERVSLGWRGEGPLPLVLAEFRRGGRLRALVPPDVKAHFAPGEHGQRPRLGGALRPGALGVILQGPTGAFARSQVEFASGEIDEDLEAHFNRSVQIPTRLTTRMGLGPSGLEAEASAILVQCLPGGGSELLPTLDATTDLGPDSSPDALLEAVFGRDGYTILERIPLSFSCPCSVERVHASVKLLEEHELEQMIASDETARIRCEFCRDEYVLNRPDLASILAEKRRDKDTDTPSSAD